MSRSHRNNLQQLNGPGFVENRFAASLRMSGDTPDGFIREDSGAQCRDPRRPYAAKEPQNSRKSRSPRLTGYSEPECGTVISRMAFGVNWSSS